MSALITNGRAFPGTSINVSTNLINIGFGEKVLVNAGIVNTVIIGGWNRLFAGASTVINLGTKMDASLTNSTNIVFGNSWHYLDTNQTTHDLELRWAENQLEICAGVRNNLLSQTSNHAKQIGIVFAIVAMFSFTLGMSILATLVPPFTTKFNEEDNPVNELNSYGTYVILGEILGIICLFLTQYMLAKKWQRIIQIFIF